MIDHFNLPVSDSRKSFEFYRSILKPLGYIFLFQDKDAYGFGRDHWQFGLYQSDQSINPLHIAFKAKNSAQVDQFYKLAIEVGGLCNGEPGERPDYGVGYYSAYILDFDGHNIEAVCRNQETR